MHPLIACTASCRLSSLGLITAMERSSTPMGSGYWLAEYGEEFVATSCLLLAVRYVLELGGTDSQFAGSSYLPCFELDTALLRF